MAEICAVLVVEPSDLFREFLDVIVDHAGYDVTTVAVGEAAHRHLDEQAFDIVILASSGIGQRQDPLQLAQRATERGAAVIVVLDDWSHRRDFTAAGYAVLAKPFMPRALIAELDRLHSRGAIDCEPRPTET